jgi:putative hemolysin
MKMVIEAALIAAVILLVGFFSAIETSVIQSRKLRLRALADDGNAAAARALVLVENPTRALSAAQLCALALDSAASVYAGAALGDELGSSIDPFVPGYGGAVAVGLVVTAITIFTLLFGELIPKRIAMAYPETIAMRFGWVLSLAARIFYPAVAILEYVTEKTLRMFGVAKFDDTPTQADVSNLVEHATEKGVMSPGEQDLVERALALSRRPVREIMTHRADIAYLDIADTQADILQTLSESPHENILVVRDGVDSVVGFIDKTDFLTDAVTGSKPTLEAHMRTPVAIPEVMSIFDLLLTFRKGVEHFAVVIDEYGGLQGIVTVDDVLGAIAGDIPSTDEAVEKPYFVSADGAYTIDGSMAYSEAAALLEITAPADEDGAYGTLAGFSLARLGRLPKAGDHFDWEDWSFEIVDMDGRRIDKIRAKRVQVA